MGIAVASRACRAEDERYRRDLWNVSRQAMGNFGLNLRAKMAAAYDEKDSAAFAQAAGKFMTLGRDLDSLLSCKGEFMLGKWIDDARSWAADKQEEAYYETNAQDDHHGLVSPVDSGGLCRAAVERPDA